MRKNFIWLLLCLLPFRLWAGAWMPMEADLSPVAQIRVAVSLGQAAGVSSHDCAHTDSEAQSVHLACADVHDHEAPCHKAGCQACDVCHQVGNLMALPQVNEIRASHVQHPIHFELHPGDTWPPLIQPPIT